MMMKVVLMTVMVMMMIMMMILLTYRPLQGQCGSSQFEKTAAVGRRESVTDC